MNYRYRPFCRIFCYTRNSQKPAITFLLCAYQMTFQRGAYPGRYACNNRTTLAYSWLDSRQNFNFASFPPRYSRTSTYDNCAHDSVYVRKPVLMDYKLLPYSPIQANVSFAYLGFMYSWIFIFQRRWGVGGRLPKNAQVFKIHFQDPRFRHPCCCRELLVSICFTYHSLPSYELPSLKSPLMVPK